MYLLYMNLNVETWFRLCLLYWEEVEKDFNKLLKTSKAFEKELPDLAIVSNCSEQPYTM